jgi:hypothetical protein
MCQAINLVSQGGEWHNALSVPSQILFISSVLQHTGLIYN